MGRRQSKGRGASGAGGPMRDTASLSARASWRTSPQTRAWAVFAWSLVAQLPFAVGGPLRSTPVGLFFFGDSIRYLEEGRRWAEGLPALDGGLPLRPPLTGWLLAAPWSLFDDIASVAVASKVLMLVLAAATYALFYRLIADRVRFAFPVGLLLPLAFVELNLTSAVGSEVVYRFLLVLILAAGLERPWLAGALHALATLTRAEHLYLAVALLAWAAIALPDRRRALVGASAAALLVLLPYGAWNYRTLSSYNTEHREELAAPLPEIVPVSLYGPLNFATARQTEDIFFEWTLPPPAGGVVGAVDPTDPLHHETLVHGYRVGLRTIADDPGRFLRRSAARAAHALSAFTGGWTYLDLPKGGPWTRHPIDVSSSISRLYAAACWLLIAVGLWSLREDRALLVIGSLLVLYRLALSVAFLPYLRGMLIAGPFVVLLLAAGLVRLVPKIGERLLVGLVLVFAVVQLTAWLGLPRYELSGSRAGDGRLLDDRPVTIRRIPSG